MCRILDFWVVRLRFSGFGLRVVVALNPKS